MSNTNYIKEYDYEREVDFQAYTGIHRIIRNLLPTMQSKQRYYNVLLLELVIIALLVIQLVEFITRQEIKHDKKDAKIKAENYKMALCAMDLK